MATIEKIYRITLQGAAALQKDAEAVRKVMTDTIAAIKTAKQSLQSALSGGADSATIDALTEKVTALEKQLAELSDQQKIAEKQVLQQAQAENLLAAAKLKEAQATKAQEQAELARAKAAAVNQKSEEDRLRALERQADLEAKAAKKAGTPAADIPFTSNLNEEGQVVEPGVTNSTHAVTDLDKAEQNEILTAIEWAKQKKLNEATTNETREAIVSETAAIEQNIKAQIENEQSLAANRKAQADLKKEMVNGGTEEQISKLAALRTEQALLTQSNNILSTTIRNQVKEFLAEGGSIDELRAKVNQLQQSYAGLSEAERASDFGLAIKAQLDVLEPKLKGLESEIGLFQRNVGNYTGDIVHAFEKLGISDIFISDLGKAKTQLSELEQQTNGLVVAYKKAKDEGVGDLESLQAQIHKNVTETENLRRTIGEAETQLHGMGGVGQQITTGLKEGFAGVEKNIAQFALTYFGFQQLFFGAQRLIENNAALSDSIADLQIRIHGTKDEANALVESLKNIDTRTSLAGLVDIAGTVAKKGVAQQEIAGVTKALDQLFVTLGPQEIGDTHEGVASLVKLVNIFSDDKHVTAKNIGDIGAAIQKLTTSGVATGSFLIDFAERLGAVRGVTGVTIQNVLGLGAALQELGQRNETAGTAAIQLITKIFSDVPKYAKAAGKSVDDFRKTLKDNPVEALIQVAQGLKNGQGDLEEVAKSFDEVGVKGSRVKAVLADIAGNADFMRKRLADASDAFGNVGAIADANAIKQNTFAASIDRVKKAFETAAANSGFMQLLTDLSKGLAFVIKLLLSIPFAVVATGVTLMTAAWAFYKGNVISTTIAQAANNSATLLGTIRMAAARIGLLGAAAAQKAYAVATEEATVETEALNVATKVSPLGIILAVLALLIPAFYAFGNSVSTATLKLKEHNVELANTKAVQQDIAKAVEQDTAKTIGHINALIEIIKDQNSSLETRKAAYDQLIKISPDFIGTLDNEYNATNRLAVAYDNLIFKLNQTSAAKATAALRDKATADKTQKELEAFAAKQAADEENARNKQIQAAQKNAPALPTAPASILSGTTVNASTAQNFDAQKAYDKKLAEAKQAEKNAATVDAFVEQDIKKREERLAQLRKALELYKGDQKSTAELQKQIDFEQANLDIITGANKATPAPTTQDTSDALARLKAQLADVEKQIKALDQINNRTTAQQNQLAALRKQRAEILKEIKELEGPKEKPYGGAKLTGGETDAINELDAQEAAEKARLEKAYTEKSEFVRQFGNKFEKLKIDTSIKITSDSGIGATGTTTAADPTEQDSIVVKNETDRLNLLLGINNEYLDKKIAALKRNHTQENELNAAEQKQIEEWQLQKVKNVEDTNKALFDIANRQAEAILSNQNITAQKIFDAANANPSLDNEQKVKAKEDYYNTLLKNQLVFNQKQIDNEKLYNLASDAVAQDNAKKRKEAIEKIDHDLSAQSGQDVKAQIQDTKDAATKQIDEINTNADRIRAAILNNDQLTVDQKQRQIDKLDKITRRTVLSAELAQLNIEVPLIKSLLDKNLIDTGAYAAALAAQAKKAAELAATTPSKTNAPFADGIDGFINTITALTQPSDPTQENKFTKKNAATGLSWADLTKKSFQVATEAMNEYYNAQLNRIQQEKQAKDDELDRERERLKARTQSQAEQDTIDRQYDQKKRDLDKQAAQKEKKIKLGEARMALATELGNIAASAAGNILNGITFGAAGVAQYGILSALALARYAVNVSTINSTQFAGGGKVQPANVGNGRITTAANIPTQPNGDNIYATVKKGEVILNEKQQELLGGAEAFRKIGVPGFADGGLVQTAKHFATGGFVMPPRNFQTALDITPPVLRQGSYSNPAANNTTIEGIEELKKMVSDVTAAVYASDKKDVVLNPHAVGKSLDKRQRDSKVATI